MADDGAWHDRPLQRAAFVDHRQNAPFAVRPKRRVAPGACSSTTGGSLNRGDAGRNPTSPGRPWCRRRRREMPGRIKVRDAAPAPYGTSRPPHRYRSPRPPRALAERAEGTACSRAHGKTVPGIQGRRRAPCPPRGGRRDPDARPTGGDGRPNRLGRGGLGPTRRTAMPRGRVGDPRRRPLDQWDLRQRATHQRPSAPARRRPDPGRTDHPRLPLRRAGTDATDRHRRRGGHPARS